MAILWMSSVLLAWHFESQSNPQVQATPGRRSSGANMEGKEVRFGIPGERVVRGLDDRARRPGP